MAPHHSYWDRACMTLDKSRPGFDRGLPMVGTAGRRARRQRRGLGYAFGTSFRSLGAVARLDLRSKRLWALLWRRKWSLLGALAVIGTYLGILLAAMLVGMGSPVFFGVIFAMSAASSGLAIVRRQQLEAWPLMALCRRRCALMYSSRRYRGLHVDAGLGQSADQLGLFVRVRREHWSERLEKLTYAQKNGFAYREFWWAPLLGLAFMVVYLPQWWGGRPFSPNLLVFVLAFQIVTWFLPSWMAKRRLSRLRRSLEDLSCPDCGYPLADFSVGTWRGQSVAGLGPARCMECGSPWPLLPPPKGRPQK